MHENETHKRLSVAGRGAGIGVQAAGIGSVLGVPVLYICFFLDTSQSIDHMVDFSGVLLLWLIIGLALTFCIACLFGAILGGAVGTVTLIVMDSKNAPRMVIVVLSVIVGLLTGLAVSTVVARLFYLDSNPYGVCELISSVLAGSISGGWYGIKITAWTSALQTNSPT